MSGREACLGVATGAGDRRAPAAGPWRAQEQFLVRLAAAHASAMLGYALRLVGDPQVAQEVVEQVMAQAWQFRGEAAGAAAVRSRMLASVRRLAVQRHLSTTRGASAAPQVGVLRMAIEQLSAEHRRVLLELCVHRRSVVEAAAVMGVPAGTVPGRLLVALQQLRSGLAALQPLE